MIGRILLLILTLVFSIGYQSRSSQKASSSQTTSSSKTSRSFGGYELVDKTGNIRKPAVQ